MDNNHSAMSTAMAEMGARHDQVEAKLVAIQSSVDALIANINDQVGWMRKQMGVQLEGTSSAANKELKDKGILSTPTLPQHSIAADADLKQSKLGFSMENEVSTEYVNMELNDNNKANELDMITDTEDTIEDPKIGMMFDSSNEILRFYLKYGKKMGFAVSKRTSRKGQNGEVRYVTITCAREGKSRRTSKNPINLHPVSKTNCRARVSATCCPDGRWIISSVVVDHNHELSPAKSRFYRCNRGMQPHVKRRLELNDMAGIQMNKSFNSFVVEVGGHENLPFQEKDCRNYIDRVRRLRLGEGDAIAIHNYFLKMQADNSNFFYMMDLAEDCRLKSVFWADARSRAAVKEFGDVITFDTTYLTNKYDMPFAPFVGVNHHGQSVLLGCGLISNEDVETFTWLFRSWLTCMSETPPSAIITDQDKAMKRAIEIVFPSTRHRWCLWHIMKKLPEKLGAHKHYKSIKSCMKTAVYDSLTIAEFEDNWCKLIMKYNLEDNEWLSGLYEERSRWVPAFVKDCFWAGMSTTQRSESMNAFFDGYVNSKTSLKQFVEQYENALRSKVEKENDEDFKSFNSWIPCITPYEMEKQFQREYTTSKFREFQHELAGKMLCELSACVEGIDKTVEYGVCEDVPIGEEIRRATFKVWYNEDAKEIGCNCRLFQFRGILCRHAITVLVHRKVYQIPTKYILKRWSKIVKRSHTKVKISYDDWSTKPEARRFDNMCSAFYEVADMATDSDERFNKVITWIHELKRNLATDSSENSQPITKKSKDAPLRGDGICRTKESINIHSPMAVRCKGRPPSNRKHNVLEKVVKKKRDKKKKEIQATGPPIDIDSQTQGSRDFGQLGGYVHPNSNSTAQASHDFGHSNMFRGYVHSNLDSQTQGIRHFGHSNMIGRYVHPNADSQTQGTPEFARQNIVQGFGQPNMVRGFRPMSQQFDISNDMQPFFYDLTPRFPTKD